MLPRPVRSQRRNPSLPPLWFAAYGGRRSPDGRKLRQVKAALRASEARSLRESERFLALHRASTLLATQSAGASEVLDQVLHSAVTLLGGGSGSLYRWDAEAELLRCVRNYHVPARDVTPDVRSGEGLAGQTYLQREPIVVNDYHSWGLAMSTGRIGGMRAGLGVPLIRHGTCLGVLLVRVYEDEQVRPFDLDDARLATLFGDQVAAALLAAEAFAQQHHAALHDALTGLPNRTLLADRVQQAILASQREGKPLALLVMDLDRFKDVNDSLGHAAGDALLHEVGVRLAASLRASDTVARLGGDEFAVLLPETEPGQAKTVAGKLIKAIAQPFVQEGHVIEVGLSVGAATFPEHGEDAATLHRHADVAMYAAKRGGGGYVGYTLERGQLHLGRLAHLGELRRALDRGELLVHWQPRIGCRERQVVAAEALVAWHDPERGLLGPGGFRSLVGQSGLAERVTWRLLEVAIKQCGMWRSNGLDVPVAVHISLRDLHDPRLMDLIRELLAAEGVAPGSLELEITEGGLLADADRTAAVLGSLRLLGVRVGLGHFGSSVASLTCLQRLRVDSLKIDASFINHVADDQRDLEIVRSVIALGHNLGLTVVADGVASAASLQELRQLGCDAAQGDFLSPPLTSAQLEHWIQTSTPPRQAPLPA